MMEARTFLQAVAGFTQGSAPEGSASAPVKIGTIDVAYSGTGFAKVKFDGESATSTKAYPFLASYFPVPGDRVVLMPAGNTYVIVGKIDNTVNNLVKRVAALEARSPYIVKPLDQATASASTATLTTSLVDVPGASINFTPLGANSVALIFGSFDFQTTVAGTGANAVTVGQLNVDGADIGTPVAAAGRTIVNRDINGQWWIVTGLSAAAHTAKLRARITGTGGTSIVALTQTNITGILFDTGA